MYLARINDRVPAQPTSRLKLFLEVRRMPTEGRECRDEALRQYRTKGANNTATARKAGNKQSIKEGNEIEAGQKQREKDAYRERERERGEQ